MGNGLMHFFALFELGKRNKNLGQSARIPCHLLICFLDLTQWHEVSNFEKHSMAFLHLPPTIF
jgi:hypothetical protein